MIVVIQCAARKNPSAGFLRASSGKRVVFVANPLRAPEDNDVVYAHPDDRDADGFSWREKLVTYNKSSDNPFELVEAISLYENPTYRRLAQKIRPENLMILSAGWGLVPSRFYLPYYDISFSNQAISYAQRKRARTYQDFRLELETDEPVIFLGGRGYIPLFCELTAMARKRIIYYNSTVPPLAPGCELKRFETTTRTNWHYECANALIEGKLSV